MSPYFLADNDFMKDFPAKILLLMMIFDNGLKVAIILVDKKGGCLEIGIPPD